MTLFDKYKTLAKKKSASIGIGIGNDPDQNNKILTAINDFLEKFNSKVLLFGNKQNINLFSEENIYKKLKDKLILITQEEPHQAIFSYLMENKMSAAVRGALPSHSFLEKLKEVYRMEETYRFTLLETANNNEFFYGPVGIDECSTFKEKQCFIDYALDQFQKINIRPKISVLSGGRKGDEGRDPLVDKSMQTAENLVTYFQKEYADLEIYHDEILIEKAIQRNSNLIIAPDGISGNLIYRTLVHLGGGKAYGAICMGIDNIIIDTSRVGEKSEIYGALTLALALS